jgi:hypothetical protein
MFMPEVNHPACSRCSQAPLLQKEGILTNLQFGVSKPTFFSEMSAQYGKIHL